MTQKKILDWVKTNKVLVAILGFLSLVVLFFLFNLWSQFYYGYGGGFFSSGYDEYSYGDDYSDDYYDYAPTKSSPSTLADGGLGGFMSRSSVSAPSFMEKTTELEIREGRATIKSQNGETDLEKLTELTDKEGGYIESSSKRDTRTSLIINAQARIPSDKFEEYIGGIKEMFEIESFELFDYRIDVQRQIDELEVVMLAMEDYNKLREETLKTESGEERIKILSSIVSEMQNLARRQRELERELGGTQRQSDLSTVSFTFIEDVKVKLWPENLGNRFRERINWTIDNVITTTIFLLANVVVLFVKVVEYIIYLFVIVLPIMFVWKLIKKIRKK